MKSGIKCIGFDGKKDKNTKVVIMDQSKKSYEQMTEDHIVYTN